MRILLVTILALAIAGCASAPAKKTDSPLAAATPIPTPAPQKMMIAGETLNNMAGSKSCAKVVSKIASLSDDMKSAAACARAGQWTMVEEFGNQMAIQFPGDAWGSYFLSLSAEHNKDWPRARWMIELAVKKSPNEGLCLYQLGRLQWLMGEKMTALDTLKKASDKNASLVDAHVLMGQIAMFDQKKSDAEKSFLKAYEVDAKNLAALMGLAEVYRMNKNWVEAEKYLRRAVSAHPKHLEARLQLAQGLETFAQDMSGALDVYREIKKLDQKKELDATPAFDLNAKIQTLQASVAEQMKRKMSERQPSGEGKKVSK
jgi:tetratricopeptide (TPR) repeat protein